MKAQSLKKTKLAGWIRSLTAPIQQASSAAPPSLQKGGKFLLLGALGILLLISSFRWVEVKREAHSREAELRAGPLVRIASVTRSQAERTINVIGETKPYASVTLYAKVSGYLKEVRVDKGDVVKKGQILAIIESPETDKEYLAALADATNKKNIANRMKALLAKNLVSQQEAEQAISDADVTQARLDTQAIQKDYETLRAPFAGTVTSRYADAGALMQNAANSQTSSLPVVTVSQINELRIYVYLDQKDATFIKKGDAVVVSLPERPEFRRTGTVTRLSGELDTRTRMLLTEVDLENKNNDVVAGSFVQVSLKISTPRYLEIPVESLVLKQDKSLVPVLQKDNTVSFKEVRVFDNDGKKIQILSGLSEGDQVALNLGTSVPEGGRVRPIVPESKPETKAEPKK